jgi:Tfp pilus assembly protein PilV
MMSPRDKFIKALRRFVPVSSDRPGRTSRARSEEGETLVEVLLSVIILGIASVALIAAFGTDISASAEHRSLANFDTALASSIATTTSLIQQQYAAVFAACPATPGSLAGYPSTAALTAAVNIPGYTASIQASGTLPGVEYTGTSESGFTTTCTAATPSTPSNVGDPQLITLVVTDTQTGYSETNSVVVDDPTTATVSSGNSSGATQLVFATQPDGATAGSNFSTQPILEVLDSTNHIVTTDLSPITLTLIDGTSGATLSSTCSGVETSGVVVYSGCSINDVGTGYELTASEPSPTQPGSTLTKSSAPFNVYAAQLETPTISAVTSSTSTAGAINVTFSQKNAPSGQTYTIKACTDFAMSQNCTTPTAFTSGNDLTGLTQGTYYYVQITAVATANNAASTSPPPATPTMATVQLGASGTPALSYGPTAGSLSVTFAPPTITAPSQTYTVYACTNNAFSASCANISTNATSATLTGLTFIPGSLAPTYFVWVAANASTGYLAYTPTGKSTAFQAATSQVATPTGLSAAPSSSQVGVISSSFSETTPQGGIAPSSFTAVACPVGTTTGCVTVNNYTSGAPISGLTPGTSYTVQITAVASTTGFVSAATALSSPALATVQLATPTAVMLGYGPTAGSVSVSFTPPTMAAANQIYTVEACTNAGMTQGCVTNTNFTGSNLTNLPFTAGKAGATYWVEVSANLSSGYLASQPSTPISQAETSQLLSPTGVTVGYGSTAGSLSISFAPPTLIVAPQTYTVEACTNLGMTQGCVTNTNFASGSDLTNLPFTQGQVGATYWVEVSANGSAAYQASAFSASSNHAEMSEIGTPGAPSLSRPTQNGSHGLVATFNHSTGTAPSSYSATFCNTVTAVCVTATNYVSGTTYTGVTTNQTYTVQITAIGPVGYLNAVSTVSSSQVAK